MANMGFLPRIKWYSTWNLGPLGVTLCPVCKNVHKRYLAEIRVILKDRKILQVMKSMQHPPSPQKNADLHQEKSVQEAPPPDKAFLGSNSNVGGLLGGKTMGNLAVERGGGTLAKIMEFLYVFVF